MSVSIKPLGNRFEAWYYDGKTPLRHPIAVELSPEGLRIFFPDGEQSVWSYAALRIASNGDYGEPVRLERNAGAPGEAAVISGIEFVDALDQYAPDLVAQARPFLDLGSWQSVLVSCLGVAALAGLFYFTGA